MPEVVLEHPELVAQLHREFVHAGSDVVEAFTYYAHREKMRLVGKEHLLEEINRQALQLAKDVAAETGTLLPATSATRTSSSADDESRRAVRAMFEEQVGWAADAGVDFVIGETFSFGEEALIALEAIRAAGPAGRDHARDPPASRETREGWTPEDACKRLEDAGADVVGLNCIRGPRDDAAAAPSASATPCGGHVAALPVPYRTTDERAELPVAARSATATASPTAGRSRPRSTRSRATATRSPSSRGRRKSSASRYLGVCCGAAPHHIRSLAEALGRTPPASRYSADMSKHAFLGTDERAEAREPGVRGGALEQVCELAKRRGRSPPRTSDTAGSCRAGPRSASRNAPRASAARATRPPAGPPPPRRRASPSRVGEDTDEALALRASHRSRARASRSSSQRAETRSSPSVRPTVPTSGWWSSLRESRDSERAPRPRHARRRHAGLVLADVREERDPVTSPIAQTFSAARSYSSTSTPRSPDRHAELLEAEPSAFGSSPGATRTCSASTVEPSESARRDARRCALHGAFGPDIDPSSRKTSADHRRGRFLVHAAEQSLVPGSITVTREPMRAKN